MYLCEYAFSKEKPAVAETCYLDNNYVLLYKIINWWNDSQTDEDNIICGNFLKCEATGISQVRYNAEKELLTIKTDSNIQDILSIFKQCKVCWGPSSFKCTYLNEKYFENNSVENASKITGSINTI